MPLLKKASKKAFEHNIRTEMEAHPEPGKRKQNIAIAYSVQREARKKHKKASGGTVQSGSKDMNMAEGGAISAKSEKRPMPEDLHNDSIEASHNRHKKALIDSDWTDRPTEKQAIAHDVRGKKLPIKRPRMVPTDAFSTRLYDEEGQLEESARPGPYGEQPPKHDDEEGPDRQGPKVPDTEDEHSTGRKPYARGGKIESKDRESHNISHRTPMEPADDREEAYERADQNDHMREDAPSHDEGRMHAHELDEEGQNRQGPDIPDMEDEHSTHRKPYAEGGDVNRDILFKRYTIEHKDKTPEEHKEREKNLQNEAARPDIHPDLKKARLKKAAWHKSMYAGGGEIEDSEENIDDDSYTNPAEGRHSPDDSEDQPEDEYDEEHHNSIAAAIMARRDRLHAEIDSGAHDLDSAVRMARGGEILEDSDDILSHDSIYSDDSDQADLSRNHDEDANEEDQLSFNALRKENYNTSNLNVKNPKDSAQMGDDEEHDSENKHSMIESIRRKMKSKRQF